MYLSYRDIKWAIECGHLIVKPSPEEKGSGFDETSIDLHLDDIREAQIWNTDALREAEEARASGEPEVRIGRFNYGKFSERYLTPLPEWSDLSQDQRAAAKVFRRGPQAIVKPGGFLLWQTEEWVGTPAKNPGLICFVDGKSTRSRTGLLVHLTAPTIHAGWSGHITLEIANVGPFHFVLETGDVIAQLTVAMISNAPDLALKTSKSATMHQKHVSGNPEDASARSRRKKRRRKR
jgi:dCTP deaminase